MVNFHQRFLHPQMTRTPVEILQKFVYQTSRDTQFVVLEQLPTHDLHPFWPIRRCALGVMPHLLKGLTLFIMNAPIKIQNTQLILFLWQQMIWELQVLGSVPQVLGSVPMPNQVLGSVPSPMQVLGSVPMPVSPDGPFIL